MYDTAYVADKARIRDPKCKHEETAIRDGRFRKESSMPTAWQHVCTICGLVSKWNKLNKKGVCIITFPKIRKGRG